MAWRHGDFIALMERQIVSVECSVQLEDKARAFFPNNKVRVIKNAQPDFWAIITHTDPFIDTPGPRQLRDTANGPWEE